MDFDEDFSSEANNALTSGLAFTATDFPSQQDDRELNDRVAERFFVKRTRRSFDLSTISNSTWMIKLRLMSAKLEQAMKRKGFIKNPDFFLGPKVPSNAEDRQIFATPKHYICECCKTKLFEISAYIKHLKKHKVNNRCSGCQRIFDHVFMKKRHELTCSKKWKLKFS
ncbi:uncharacterized protein LOC131674890 [Phymastichus coffea]|uniref:uncharacterized protein LOC131666297 n=1 Tax=Phymastichus coffea TaxID=108790 RepID=UPI00273C4A92|nr:uncharacterized protein LOC131666297 [Phymastichus coffea]XP_058809688.1 uncharacterized protein LOC131674890 [Phymastichus coffea]